MIDEYKTTEKGYGDDTVEKMIASRGNAGVREEFVRTIRFVSNSNINKNLLMLA